MADHSPEMAAIIAKYPALRKTIETGVESNDGRESSLLAFLQSHPSRPLFATSAPSLLAAIDEFSHTHDFLISIGPHKSAILSDLLERQISSPGPSTVLELGGYLGYSAILFADALVKRRRAEEENGRGGEKAGKELRVYSLEMSPEFAAIARSIIALANLSHVITVVVGPADSSLRTLASEVKLDVGVDMLFIDHVEELYVQDFKVCEELGLLKRGTVVVADNVVKPGAPEYRALVREHERLRSEGVRGLIVPGDLEDELEISWVVSD